MGSGLLQLAFRRNAQFLTTLCTTASQNFTAISCLHTLAKTVNGFTTTTVWLKCSFHFTVILRPQQILPVESQATDFQSHRATIPACVVKGTAKVVKSAKKTRFLIRLYAAQVPVDRKKYWHAVQNRSRRQ